MHWFTTVLSSVSSDTEPTIVVQFDSAKYIFNAGENTGRSWLQSNLHYKKARGIFLTSVGTQRGSGLAGLLMFLADADIRKVDITGPRGVLHYIASFRSYVTRDMIGVNVIEFPSSSSHSGRSNAEPDPIYKDENITVYGVPVDPTPSPSAIPPQDERARPEYTSRFKRKRSTSPPSSSSKRAAPERALEIDASLEDLYSSQGQPLIQRMLHPRFLVPLLAGEDAQEWRRLVIQRMFPYVAPPLQPKANVQKQQKQKGKQDKKDNPLAATADEEDTSSPVLPLAPSPDEGQVSQYQMLNPLPLLVDIFAKGPISFPNTTLCYIILGPRVRGKFDAAKATELGIPTGPVRKKLARGETVTIEVDDGNGGKTLRTVQPEECVAPSESPQVMIILDVPTVSHIPSLMASFSESPFFAKFRSKSAEHRKEYPVHAVFHLCGDGVLESEEYKLFMNGFSDDTHHIISSRKHAPDPVTFTSAAYTQTRLNQIDSNMFPIPKSRLNPHVDLTSLSGLPQKASTMRAHLRVGMRPPRDPVQDKEMEQRDLFHPLMASSTALPSRSEEFTELKIAAQKRMERSDVIPQPGDDIKVIPLGTSSSVPSKYRNVSSTFVQIPGHGSMLLDCGEGSWGQLTRVFGDDLDRSAGVWQVLRDLKCIFLSHAHGDHHIGLAKILAMRQQLDPPPSEPIYVVGIRPVLLYLMEQSQLENLGWSQHGAGGVIPVLSDVLVSNMPQRYRGVNPQWEPYMNDLTSRMAANELCKALGFSSFTTVEVVHRTRAFGVVIRHQDGWSLVFSGDTMPTTKLSDAGQHATLLIHEATMANDQRLLAQKKAHSTIGQAIDIGKKMNAQHILLTHFSARYPKFPDELSSSEYAGTPGMPIVAAAFDYATFTIGDMWKLNTYLPAIAKCFAETKEDDGDDEIITSTW